MRHRLVKQSISLNGQCLVNQPPILSPMVRYFASWESPSLRDGCYIRWDSLGLRASVLKANAMLTIVKASFMATVCIIAFNKNIRLVNNPTSYKCFVISYLVIDEKQQKPGVFWLLLLSFQPSETDSYNSMLLPPPKHQESWRFSKPASISPLPAVSSVHNYFFKVVAKVCMDISKSSSLWSSSWHI